jgi:hypothetical protein
MTTIRLMAGNAARHALRVAPCGGVRRQSGNGQSVHASGVTRPMRGTAFGNERNDGDRISAAGDAM